jgi:protein O-GlcNAc transferase
MDALIGRILERDSAAQFLCVETLEQRWSDKLRGRFARTLGDSARRVVFVPRQSGVRWQQLIEAADVVVDTPHFSGMITTLDALSAGVPVVTCPGVFARGRQTQGIYRWMGMGDCVAPTPMECADLAVDIACHPDRRRALSAAIGERIGVVFEDPAAVSELERFLDSTTQSTCH